LAFPYRSLDFPDFYELYVNLLVFAISPYWVVYNS